LGKRNAREGHTKKKKKRKGRGRREKKENKRRKVPKTKGSESLFFQANQRAAPLPPLSPSAVPVVSHPWSLLEERERERP
jgi:hypothetical protein